MEAVTVPLTVSNGVDSVPPPAKSTDSNPSTFALVEKLRLLKLSFRVTLLGKIRVENPPLGIFLLSIEKLPLFATPNWSRISG